MNGPRIGSLFSGYGGLEMGVQSVLGGHTAWVSDIDPGACKILAHRYPGVPNLGDITQVDWATVPPVDILTGGSPCTDVSQAGQRKGMRPGTRSGLWASMCDAIEIMRPSLVVWENVGGVLSAGADSALEPCPVCVGDDGDAHLRALGRVTGDLSEIGFDAEWVAVPASDAGACHGRLRVFLLAWPVADSDGFGSVRAGGAWGWRPRSADADRGLGGRGGAPTTDTDRAGTGRDGRAVPREAGESGWTDLDVRAARDARGVASDTDGGGRGVVGWVEPEQRDVDGCGRPDRDGWVNEPAAWGKFWPAVHRWGTVLGRPAPCPTEPAPKGGRRLSARFEEWMMGLPGGWVTAVPGLSWADQVKALGNGVCPQQAALALQLMLGAGLAARESVA